MGNATSPSVTGNTDAWVSFKPHGQVMLPLMETGKFLLNQDFCRVPYNFSHGPEPPCLYGKEKKNRSYGCRAAKRASSHFVGKGQAPAQHWDRAVLQIVPACAGSPSKEDWELVTPGQPPPASTLFQPTGKARALLDHAG